MNIKKYHIILGLLLTLFGIVCTSFSIINYLKPELEVNIINIKNTSINECQQEGINAGFNVMKSNDNLTFTPKGDVLNNPTPYMYKASLLIEKCSNLHVEYFCMGEECDNPLILKMKFPKI